MRTDVFFFAVVVLLCITGMVMTGHGAPLLLVFKVLALIWICVLALAVIVIGTKK